MSSKYVICISNEGYEVSLTPFKVYRVGAPLPGDELAREDGLIRVIDDSGEDYLFEADLFVELELPRAAEEAFARETA